MTPMLGIMASQISGKLFTLAGNYDALATVTVPSGGLSSITFAGIPTTGYTHLQVRCFSQTNRTIARDSVKVTLNSDTAANYSAHSLYGDGATAGSYALTSATSMELGNTTSSTATNIFGIQIIDVLDYANTNKYKTLRALGGGDFNGTIATYGATVGLASGNWRSTSAVTSLTITPYAGTLFSQYSSFALYGVK
jgi:hypothetical protein